METIEKTKNLSGVFFAPNRKDLMPLIIEVVKSFRFSMDATANKIASRIISRYWVEYNETCDLAKPDNFGRQQGDFNLNGMIEEIQDVINLIKLLDFFKRPSYYGIGEIGKDYIGQCGISYGFKAVTCENSDLNVFALALCSEVINTYDNDCYQTAGGYRSYKSSENPLVYLRVDSNGIQLKFESSLMVDHYNNNFFGVSTGGGTTTYKEGEQIVTRVINTKMYNVKEVLEKYNLTIKKMDTQRGINALSEFDNI